MPAASNLNRKSTRLFKLFSRMEYALKATGFHCGEGNATANWTGFAKSDEIEALIANPRPKRLVDAIAVISGQPPRKQVVVNDTLQWADVPPNSNSDADILLQYVRRIRNNLFHGGKFNGNWFAPQRSERLIDAAITILNSCRKAHPCLLYTSPSPRDLSTSRMPSSA